MNAALTDTQEDQQITYLRRWLPVLALAPLAGCAAGLWLGDALGAALGWTGLALVLALMRLRRPARGEVTGAAPLDEEEPQERVRALVLWSSDRVQVCLWLLELTGLMSLLIAPETSSRMLACTAAVIALFGGGVELALNECRKAENDRKES